ncbi:PREDICTED: pleckstrin homology domain-containing family A member 3-like [Papilio polytes]|uniref:pleckstrin homology domain-containing family A member 3-like n=1 Tax=Papilio polytes TaxID=76194 RepID=UPI000675CF50|nr:PREDICTED: pleckstrin homology domain-containing family A member 3-like [Papilio polytes]
MEGVLWKWTNYWNGWQTRWFVLENGILSYYKSEEEVFQGCKGSVKVSVCQINVNNIDNTRLDLVIPGQQHMYLRAPSPQDRQKWLVALGSAKACVDKTDTIAPEFDNSLGHKKSELRLYCDLMMQQVHFIKGASYTDSPENKRVEEEVNLLKATCDTFIKTLEEIMRIANYSGNATVHDMPIPNLNKLQSNSKNTKSHLNRTVSQENR